MVREGKKNLLANELRLDGQLYYCCHSHAQWWTDLGRQEIKPRLSYGPSLHITHWRQWTLWSPKPSLGWVWGTLSEMAVSWERPQSPIFPQSPPHSLQSFFPSGAGPQPQLVVPEPRHCLVVSLGHLINKSIRVRTTLVLNRCTVEAYSWGRYPIFSLSSITETGVSKEVF